MLTVDSIERRRFEGLDMVVPKELVRECVRLCIGIEGGVRGPLPTGIASWDGRVLVNAGMGVDMSVSSVSGSASISEGGMRSFQCPLCELRQSCGSLL